MLSTLFLTKTVKLSRATTAVKTTNTATQNSPTKKHSFFSPAHLRFLRQMLLPNRRPVRIIISCAKPPTRTQQWKKAIATTVLILACGSYGPVYGLGANATDSTRYTFDIPSLKVEEALSQLAKQTGHQLLFSYALVNSHNSTAVKGEHSLTSALQQLLQTTPLTGHLTERGVIVVTDTSARNHMEKGRGNMNITTKKGLLAGLVGLFAAGGMTQAVAQGGEAATGQSAIDEIIVTANKREQSLQEVPMSVAALTGKDLKDQGIDDLQALALAVPGLHVNDGGAFTRRITIRGIGNAFGSSSLVGVYIDDAAVVGHGAMQLDLRMFDLERVEVLKGPQGTLYGEGSVGGTIRYITRNPELGHFGGEVAVDGSTTNSGSSSQKVEGVLNLPLNEDSLAVRIAARYVNAGGWVDQPSISKKDVNSYELYNVRSKLLWQPSDAFSLSASAIFHRNDTGASGMGEDENGNFKQIFNDLTTPSLTDDYDFVSFTVSYDFDNLTFVSTSSYLDSERHAKDFGSRCCVLASGNTPEGLWHAISENVDNTMEVFTQEFRLSSNSSDPWYWSAGLYGKDARLIPFHWYGDDGDSGTIRFGDPDGFFLTFDQFYTEIESTSWALFGETSYALTDKLEIGAGVRVFNDDQKHRSDPAQQFREDSFDSVNPRIYMSYDLNDDVHLYTSVAKGFRSGGLNAPGLPSFDPETVLTYELGSKMSAREGRLNAELALFYSDYDDYQIVGFDATIPALITANAGNAKVQGVDLYLKYLILEDFELGFTGNYTDTEFTEINGVTGTSHAVGDPLDQAALFGYSLWANYLFRWSDQAAGYFRIDYNRQGKAHFRNRSFDVPAEGFSYHSTSDEIETLNARLAWEQDSWSIELYGDNLLGESGLLGEIDVELLATRAQPRTVGVKIGYNF